MDPGRRTNGCLIRSEPAVASRQVGELVEALSTLGVPCSKVNFYKDVFENEHAR